MLPTDPREPTPTERVAAACAKSPARFKLPREVRVLKEFQRATLEKVSKAKLRAMLTEAEGAEDDFRQCSEVPVLT